MKHFKEDPTMVRTHINISNSKNKPLPKHPRHETPAELARLRHRGLLARAHAIAIRLHQISKPYLDRDEAMPRDLLVREFELECDKTDKLRGGPLTHSEIQSLATTLVPNALAAIRRTIETADGRLTASMQVVDHLLEEQSAYTSSSYASDRP